MLAHSIRITDRTAYEVFEAETITLELYRAATDWFYIVEARQYPTLDDELDVIHRRAVPGRFTTRDAGVEALTAMAAKAEDDVKEWLEYEERQAIAQDIFMRRQDPSDPLYWATAGELEALD